MNYVQKETLDRRYCLLFVENAFKRGDLDQTGKNTTLFFVMKLATEYLFFLLILIAFLGSCNSQQDLSPAHKAIIKPLENKSLVFVTEDSGDTLFYRTGQFESKYATFNYSYFTEYEELKLKASIGSRKFNLLTLSLNPNDECEISFYLFTDINKNSISSTNVGGYSVPSDINSIFTEELTLSGITYVGVWSIGNTIYYSFEHGILRFYDNNSEQFVNRCFDCL